EILAQPLGLAQDRARVLEQGAARRRRRDALPPAQQQRRAERVLHVADARRGGRKGKVRAFRAMRDAACLDHVAEEAEISEIEAHFGVPSDFAKEGYAFSGLCAGILRRILRQPRSPQALMLAGAADAPEVDALRIATLRGRG